jgi:hypothetical protein
LTGFRTKAEGQSLPAVVVPNVALLSALLLAHLAGSGALQAQPVIGAAWTERGPAPTINAQAEGLPGPNPVVGAVQALAQHPTNANILYAGAVNGGVWKTTNATAAPPTWSPLTDSQRGGGITSLEMDPTDATNSTVVACTGNRSSLNDTTNSIGCLRTFDGGATWQVLNGVAAPFLAGRTILGVAPRGATLVLAVSAATSNLLTDTGIYRSTNNGSNWTRISGGAGTGLPSSRSYDLARDPANTTTLYTSASGGAASNGIYRSTNTGATWAKISNAAVDAFFTASTNNVRISANGTNVFVGIVQNGRLSAVFAFNKATSVWTSLGVPSVTEPTGTPFGVHPGGQGSIHFSFAAHPTNANLVFVGGDRQPYRNEPGNPVQFPNAIGANNFTGRLFRGDASLPAATRWQHLTHSNASGPAGGGTSNNSAPHADSRDMVFDLSSNLIESDDGGVYRRTLPQNNTGSWTSINGNLRTTELHAISEDENNLAAIGGTQDIGTPFQTAPASLTWTDWIQGDGGDTDVALNTAGAGISTRFSSAQFLGSFNRSFWNAANANVAPGFNFPALTPAAGSPAVAAQFYTPIKVNPANQLRLVIGAANGVYESFDQGNNVTRISTLAVGNGGGWDPIAYGTAGNNNILYIGVGTQIYVRTAAPPAALALTAFNGAGNSVRDIVVNPGNANEAFAVTAAGVFRTTNAGAAWANVTGLLGTFGVTRYQSLAFLNTAAGSILAVGTNRGVFATNSVKNYATWGLVGNNMPQGTIVYDLDFNLGGNRLTAGLLGRGAWLQTNVSALFAQISALP